MLSKPSPRTPFRTHTSTDLSFGLEKVDRPPNMMQIMSGGLLIEKVLKSILPNGEQEIALAKSWQNHMHF